MSVFGTYFLHQFSYRESFELLLIFGKSSFLRKHESSLFKNFWIHAYETVS
jgi:hypothetical protein